VKGKNGMEFVFIDVNDSRKFLRRFMIRHFRRLNVRDSSFSATCFQDDSKRFDEKSE
jgi:hypothetical protein